MTFALKFRSLNNAIETKAAPKDKIIAYAQTLKPNVQDFFKDYDKALDRDVTIALLNLFYKDVNHDQLPAMIKKVGDKSGGDFTAFVDNAFAKSVLVDPDKLNAWIEKPKSLSKDPIYALMYDILQSYPRSIVVITEPFAPGLRPTAAQPWPAA